MRERFKHLNSVEDMHSPNDPDFARWADTRLDRWLVDWSLRNGKEKTAKMIADERGVEVSMIFHHNAVQNVHARP